MDSVVSESGPISGDSKPSDVSLEHETAVKNLIASFYGRAIEYALKRVLSMQEHSLTVRININSVKFRYFFKHQD